MDIRALIKPGAIVPVDIDTTRELVWCVARLHAALEKIVEADRWNSKMYTGVDEWRYGECAAIARVALDGGTP